MNLTVTIDTASLSASLEAQAKAIADGDGMHGAIARSVNDTVRDHLTRNYLPRDGPRGDFWADVIRSTESTSDATSATVALTELGVTLRYHGGEVTPGKSISSYTGEITRALAVPSSKVPVASGRQVGPQDAGVLAFVRKKGGGETVGYLVQGIVRLATRGKNKGKPYNAPKPGGALLYTLRTITRHKADPGILPSDEALVASAKAAILDHIGSFE